LIWHAGIFSDYLGRGKLIVCGWGMYAAIYFGFGMATAAWHVAALYVLYGLYYGAFEGLPVHRWRISFRPIAAVRLTASLTRLPVLRPFPASVIAGLLWQLINPAAPFFFGAVLALVSACLLSLVPKPRGDNK